MKPYHLNCRGRVIDLSTGPVLMGILNVTPDSFSDGGEFLDSQAAIDQGLKMIADGAGIIDIGGESTRPGAKPVSPAEQIRRVVPVIEELNRQTNIPISIDTTSSEVAQAALEAGASIINDISALRFDEQMVQIAAQAEVPVVLMHMLGSPRTMQEHPTYSDVVEEVKSFLATRIEFAISAGIKRTQIVVDPGIGFGKTAEHNLTLLRNIRQLQELQVPVLVGPSRKSFIGKILEIKDPRERIYGTAAAVSWCAAEGAQIIRVHDVKEMSQVVKLISKICKR